MTLFYRPRVARKQGAFHIYPVNRPPAIPKSLGTIFLIYTNNTEGGMLNEGNQEPHHVPKNHVSPYVDTPYFGSDYCRHHTCLVLIAMFPRSINASRWRGVAYCGVFRFCRCARPRPRRARA